MDFYTHNILHDQDALLLGNNLITSYLHITIHKHLRQLSHFFPNKVYWLIMCISLCCLCSPGALLLHHNRLLAFQDGTGTTQSRLGKQRTLKWYSWKLSSTNKRDHCRKRWCFKVRHWAHHAQVLPVLALADDVPHAVERGASVLVDGDLLVGAGRFVLTCAKQFKELAVAIQTYRKTLRLLKKVQNSCT